MALALGDRGVTDRDLTPPVSRAATDPRERTTDGLVPIFIDRSSGKAYWENRDREKLHLVQPAAGVSSSIWFIRTGAGIVSKIVEATGSRNDARDPATPTTCEDDKARRPKP